MVGEQVHIWALDLAEEVPLGVCDQTEACSERCGHPGDFLGLTSCEPITSVPPWMVSALVVKEKAAISLNVTLNKT